MKEEILQTSLKQFLKHGIREMSIQKLIEPLGISTKTVYKYFKNKEELLEEVLHLYYSKQYQLLENLTADQNTVHLLFDIWHTAIEGSYKTNTVFFQDLHYYYPELERRVETIIGNKFSKQFIQIIQKGIKEGVFKNDMLPEVILESIYVLYNAIVRNGQYKQFKVASYELLLNTITVYIRGFCTQKGIQELEEYIKTIKPTEGSKLSRERAVAGHAIASDQKSFINNHK
jgi:AcrR family transcriptional regulator